MKKIVYKSKAVQAVILMAAFCILVSLWPLRIWQESVTTSVAPQTGTVTEVIDGERTVLQTIVAQYDHMDTISVYLGEESAGESFYLRILDEQWQVVCEEKTEIDYENIPGFQRVMIDVDMEVGKMYYVILQGDDSQIFAGCEFVPMADMPYLGTMYYADSSVDGMSLVADYNYSVPLRKTKVFLLGGMTLAVAALSLLAVRLWYRRREDRLITVERVFKFVMNPVVAAGTVVCLIAVLRGVCGNYLLDNTVYFVSILLLGMILFYGINHNRDGQNPVITGEYIRSHGGDLIQSIAIAGAIAGCCEYMSGLYDIYHAISERKEMLWFAVAVIAMFKWREIVNLYNLVYLILAGIGGWAYYRRELAAIEGPEADLHEQVLRYTVWIAILLGLILLRTVIGLWKAWSGSRKERMARPSYLYGGLLSLFFVLIIVFRNGRWWGVVMAVSFMLFYLNYGMWEHRERILVNIARGVILQFLWSTGYALLHRPYVTYRNARYTHIFHTVTITAAYLTMVECAAVVVLLGKLKKSRKLKDCWKELTLFGVVSSYMLFTMARTAFFSVGIAVLFALVMSAGGSSSSPVNGRGEKRDGKGRGWIASFAGNLGMLVLAVLVCFPVTFGLQRNIPILVSDPYLYEIEYYMYCPEDVMRGRNLDSHNFMRVGRFIDVFAEKIFGIPEGTFDLYGEIAEYERTHNEDGTEIDARAGEETGDREIPGIADSSVLVASADYVPEGVPEEAFKEKDYTNGRLDIFRSYIEQLNMTGHEEMGAVLQNGEIATHAHNIYLQVAYDHGIPVGIVFVLVGAATVICAVWYYHRKKNEITYALLPSVVAVAVAVAGMVEWIFHLSNPCGLLLMLVITPLVFKNEG